jgi:hypothetical protein
MTRNDSKRLPGGPNGRPLSSRLRQASRLLVLGGLAALGLGCSAGRGGSAEEPTAAAGEVGVSLRLADGLGIDAVRYTIAGGPTTLTGTIAVGSSATLSATLGPLQAGSGYSLSLAATTSAGAQCAGSAGPFAVAPNQAPRVAIVLTCPSLHDAGTIAVGSTTAVCPVLAALTAAPSEVYVGNDVHLVAVAETDGAANAPPLTYTWTGVTSSDGAGNAVFHCEAPGVYTVGLSIDDGNAACITTPPDPGMSSSLTVTCSENGGGAAGE